MLISCITFHNGGILPGDASLCIRVHTRRGEHLDTIFYGHYCVRIWSFQLYLGTLLPGRYVSKENGIQSFIRLFGRTSRETAQNQENVSAFWLYYREERKMA